MAEEKKKRMKEMEEQVKAQRMKAQTLAAPLPASALAAGNKATPAPAAIDKAALLGNLPAAASAAAAAAGTVTSPSMQPNSGSSAGSPPDLSLMSPASAEKAKKKGERFFSE